jgi:glycerol-3-phosphate cytidylyltransferase
MIKIGYTTGVYDMFHIGHLNVLRRAKLDCDFLIVGISTDELCYEAKNKKPIIPFVERMEIIGSLKYVDQVVPQVNYDKLEAWNNLKFDRMFVGDDWKNTEKWMKIENDLKPFGVEIIYLPYTGHTSSSILRAGLKKLIES